MACVLKEDGVDVAFYVVNGDERQVACETEGLGVSHSDEQ